MKFPNFAVASGEEGSDPLVTHNGETVRVDELAASGHLDRMDDDLAAVAGLGVGVWRYGMPWRVTEPEPGTYDWTLWDTALAACERHGLTPVVDLCHFGLPDHYPGFCDPSWVEGFCRYTDAFLARYQEPTWFTPVNEPGITALSSGLIGAWNDRRASRADYFVALAHVVLAHLEGSPAFEPTVTAGGSAPKASAATSASTTRASARPTTPAPSSRPCGTCTSVSSLVPRWPICTTPSTTACCRASLTWWRRPTMWWLATTSTRSGSPPRRRGTPAADDQRPHRRLPGRGPRLARALRPRLLVAETSNLGLPVDQQEEWLIALVARLDAMRADGLPVRGLCWYSRGDQYDWDTMLMEPVGKVTTVGLFDAQRRSRPVADAYRRLARRQ